MEVHTSNQNQPPKTPNYPWFKPRFIILLHMHNQMSIYFEYITLVANLTQEVGCQLGKVQLISGAKV